jgi:hypothetical protein
MILKRRDQTPPDGFRYVHQETGYVSWAIDIHTWFENIVAHRNANNLPPITLEMAEAQLCETIGPSWCAHSPSVQKGHGFVSTRLRWRDIVEGTKAYLSFIASGFQTVSQAEADRRAGICAGCFLQVVPQGCGACVKIGRLITGNVATKTTAHDRLLANKACAVCHCGTKSIVHFPMPLLEKADTPEKQAAYPSFCWRKQGGEAYQPEAV